MKIKEIRLYGFKSFPDETKIMLNAGITAFVGPNGSGKSNIFDALRWIFGEQSMKALRCERIEDLIFMSSDVQREVNFTDVSVTIDNENYFPQFGGEFEIRRRFYKSGESEFFLNRVKCRLQDIQALFLNSGALTYSFLELSEIEKIIHGDTKDMFNDVSGILKYQERREQTRRRLEATEQDLLRLEDIIHEMQRSLRSLRRQVRQAKLYQELKQEFKVLTLFILKNEYNMIAEKLATVQTEIAGKDMEKQSTLLEIKKLEKNREELKHEMAQIDVKKKETLAQLVAVHESIERLQRDIEEREDELKQIFLHNARTSTSIKEKGEILNEKQKRHAQYERQRSEILTKMEAIKSSIREEQEQLDAKNKECFTLTDSLKEKEDALIDYSTKIQAYRQDISRLQFEKDNKDALLARVSDEYQVQKEEIENKQRIQREIEEELQATIAKQDKTAKILEDQNAKCAEIGKNLSDLEDDWRNRQNALTECKLVIDTLNHRLKEKGGVREIEERFEKRHRGLFRSNIKVTSGYESVVDICLGDILNFYLIEDYKLQDFDRLPEGRFGFINANEVVTEDRTMNFSEDIPSITQFVQFKSSQKVLQRYIDNYFLVDDFLKANELSQKFPQYGFVTREGILLKDGMIVVEKGEIGYFKMRQSLAEYKKKHETLQNEALFIKEEKNRLMSEIESIKRDIEDEKNQLFSINVKKSEHSLKLNELKWNIEKAINENNNLDLEKNSLKKESDRLSIEIEAFEKNGQRMEDDLKKVQAEKDTLLENSQIVRSKIEQIHSTLTEKRMSYVTLEERRNTIEATLNQLMTEIVSLDAEIAKLSQDTKAKNLEDIKTQILSLKEELNRKRQEKAEAESRLPERIAEELTQNLNEIFDQLTEKQKIYEKIQDEVMQLKYELFQLNHKKDDAVERAQEEFKVDLREHIPEDEITDAEARLLEVKGKLEKLGEVNPLSLELYESEKKRLDEFLNQRDDIITAKRSLMHSIEELDRRARERFVNIFGLVKREFNFVFSNFFEGGEADLVLSDPDNPLTSKVDIVVRMKGKRLKTINQLSGGERTLLAISLLLAFYLVKPAPFCILDEIDAPLDDANVVRFNRFLRDLSQRTQVIIITHNRATMEYADYLYGLTMEKPGQSKVISARLADLEKIDMNVQ